MILNFHICIDPYSHLLDQQAGYFQHFRNLPPFPSRSIPILMTTIILTIVITELCLLFLNFNKWKPYSINNVSFAWLLIFIFSEFIIVEVYFFLYRNMTQFSLVVRNYHNEANLWRK